MKNASRFFALLLALLLLFSVFFLPACKDAKNDGQSSPDSGAGNTPTAPEESGDFDRHRFSLPRGGRAGIPI